jgi:hypothetical protein
MLRCSAIVLVWILSSAPSRAAEAEVAPALEGVAARAPAPAEAAPGSRWYGLSEGTHLGVGVDAGVPGVAGATLLFRPWWWLRLNGGFAYDYIGYGARGGLSLVPGHWGVTPTLNLDYGRYLSGDASRFNAGAGPAERALLRHAVYDFATAQLGLELGSQRWFAFYVRGGVAYVTARASGAQLSAAAAERSDDPSLRFTVGDATVRALLPCFSLGFLVYVY